MNSRSLDPAEAPIFIIGTGRSGTTLLRYMLCAHPRIYITHEAAFYMWEAIFKRRTPGREFLERYFQTFSFRWLRLDPERVLAGLPDPLPRSRLREAFIATMREKAADYGRVRFGDKTPAHAGHLKRIFEDFPGARVIHIVRDPRGTSLSLSRMPFSSHSLFCNACYCAFEWREVARWKERLLQVRLEDLLADPRLTLGRVLQFVGEPWDDAVLDHARNIPDRDDMPPVPWLENASQPLSTPTATWTSMTPLQIRAIEHLARRCMAEAPYQPAILDREPTRPAVWWESLRQLPEAARYLGAVWRLGLHMRTAVRFDPDTSHELLRQLNPSSWAVLGIDRLPMPPPLPGRRGRG